MKKVIKQKIILIEDNEKIILKGPQKNLIKLANSFFDGMEARGLSPRTVRAYGYDLLFLFRWIQKTKESFRKFTHKQFIDYIKYQRKKEAAPASINRRLVSAEMFFRFCYNKDVPSSRGVNYPATYFRSIGYDKAKGLFPIKKSTKRALRVKEPKLLIKGLEPWEVAQFFEKVTKYRDLAMVLSMLMCGLRRMEISNLKLKDVDLDARKMRVTGKGNRERVLPLPNCIITTMIKYLKLERPETKDPHFFVVLQGRRKGKAFKSSGLEGFFRYKRKTSNIKRANAHRFRHTFGRDMASCGVSLPILQRMMGHADAVTTLKYINLRMSDIAEEYEKAQKKISKRYGRN